MRQFLIARCCSSVCCDPVIQRSDIARFSRFGTLSVNRVYHRLLWCLRRLLKCYMTFWELASLCSGQHFVRISSVIWWIMFVYRITHQIVIVKYVRRENNICWLFERRTMSTLKVYWHHDQKMNLRKRCINKENHSSYRVTIKLQGVSVDFECSQTSKFEFHIVSIYSNSVNTWLMHSRYFYLFLMLFQV